MKTFLSCFRLKSIIHNNLPPVKKYISCCLSHQNVFACKCCLICADFSPDSDQNTFSLKEALLWNMDSNFDQKQWFEVRNVLMMDLFQLLSSQDVNWWTGVVWITCGLLWCFYQLFGLSFWRHPFTAEHPLLRHWCNATFLQIWWRYKHIYILNGLSMSTFSANFHFCMNYSF